MKVKLTITESSCRCGYHKKGDCFTVGDLCPPLCHELWNVIYPYVLALQNGAVLDCADGKARSFDARCPDGGRVCIHGEVEEERPVSPACPAKAQPGDAAAEEPERLLEAPYWVIDVLPEQIPADADGQYFAVEKYWLQEPRRSELRQKQLNMILKLNCRMQVRIWDGPVNPAPEILASAIGRERLNLLLGGALLVTDPDDTYMTVYNPDASVLEMLRKLAAAEGLFVWQPPHSAE